MIKEEFEDLFCTLTIGFFTGTGFIYWLNFFWSLIEW
jgi:hypothetical protein